jgi:hypothetical protein
VETPCLYDGRVAFQRPTIADVGLAVGECLSEGDESGARDDRARLNQVSRSAGSGKRGRSKWVPI